MSMMKQVQQLEDRLFTTLEASYKALEMNEFSKARAYIGTVKLLNEEYKEITKVDFISPKTILNLYERLWEKQNA